MNERQKDALFYWSFVAYLVGMATLTASGGAWFFYTLAETANR